MKNFYYFLFAFASTCLNAQVRTNTSNLSIKQSDNLVCVYIKHSEDPEERVVCLKNLIEARLISNDSLLILYHSGFSPSLYLFTKDLEWKLDFSESIYPLVRDKEGMPYPDDYLLRDTSYFKMYSIDNYNIKCISGGKELIVNWPNRKKERELFWVQIKIDAAKRAKASKKKWYQRRKRKSR